MPLNSKSHNMHGDSACAAGHIAPNESVDFQITSPTQFLMPRPLAMDKQFFLAFYQHELKKSKAAAMRYWDALESYGTQYVADSRGPPWSKLRLHIPLEGSHLAPPPTPAVKRRCRSQVISYSSIVSCCPPIGPRAWATRMRRIPKGSGT